MLTIVAVCKNPGLLRNCTCLTCRLWIAERTIEEGLDRLRVLRGDSQTVDAESVRDVEQFLSEQLAFLEDAAKRGMWNLEVKE
jgi:hypothetical protein